MESRSGLSLTTASVRRFLVGERLVVTAGVEASREGQAVDGGIRRGVTRLGVRHSPVCSGWPGDAEQATLVEACGPWGILTGGSHAGVRGLEGGVEGVGAHGAVQLAGAGAPAADHLQGRRARGPRDQRTHTVAELASSTDRFCDGA